MSRSFPDKIKLRIPYEKIPYAARRDVIWSEAICLDCGAPPRHVCLNPDGTKPDEFHDGRYRAENRERSRHKHYFRAPSVYCVTCGAEKEA